jgi:hypothetical protein
LIVAVPLFLSLAVKLILLLHRSKFVVVSYECQQHWLVPLNLLHQEKFIAGTANTGCWGLQTLAANGAGDLCVVKIKSFHAHHARTAFGRRGILRASHQGFDTTSSSVLPADACCMGPRV